MSQLSNYTYDEINIGQTASYSKEISEQDIQLFAIVSGDNNPVHLDAEFAAGTPFKERIAHGMLSGAVISAAIALELPGPGTIYLGQTMRFRRPVKIGDTLTVELEVTDKRDDKQFVTLDCKVINQNGEVVVTGTAEVIAPPVKLVLDPPHLPTISLQD
ncbi:MAG: MaoC/PaaZ C-terminal domain-containing protein [Gammaproteobacteria bacterium]|nr:MaoC/PaaZ C-terminal domain-containing protein [Gammaproteobacteria bacterium]